MRISFLCTSTKGVSIVALIVTLIFLAGYYAYRIAYFPGYDYDEIGFLNIPARFVSLGDLSYPVFLDAEGFNSEPYRKYPPILALFLRALFHSVVGFSAELSRLFSGALVLTSLTLAWWLCRYSHIPRVLSLVGLFATGFHPSVFAAARSVRLEQEIVLLGTVALFVPFLAVRGFGAAALWAASGAAAGWAGASHVWGMVFPIIIGLSLILHQGAWQLRDGLSFWRRASSWALGLSVPVSVTAFTMVHDWPVYLDYARAFAQLYAIRDQQNIAYFLSNFGADWTQNFLTPRLAAVFHQLQLYAFMSFGTGFTGSGWFRGVFWAQLIVALSSLPALLSRPSDLARLPPALMCLTAGAFLTVAALYPPNTNYYLYTAIFVPCATTFAAGWWWKRTVSNGILKRSAMRAPAYLMAASAVLSGYFAVHQVAFLTEARALEAVPLDARFAAIARMGEAFGFEQSNSAFCDMASWPACGKRMRSAHQTFILAVSPPPAQIDGAVFTEPLFSWLIENYPTMTTPLLPVAEKVSRLRQTLAPLRLAGVIRLGRSGEHTLFYERREEPLKDIVVADVNPSGSTHWYEGEAISTDSGRCRRFALPPGRYLLTAGCGPDTTVAATLDGTPVPELGEWPHHCHLEATRILNVADKGATLEISGAHHCIGLRLFKLNPRH